MILFFKNLVFTLVVPGTFAGIVPWLIVREQPIASSWYVLASLAFFIFGGAIYIWCVWDFASFGRGTPAPIDTPRKLMVRGLYLRIRNPMCVGVLTVILGRGWLFRSAEIQVYAACWAVSVQLFVTFYEEPHLHRVFGVEYEQYCSRVGRWLPSFKSPC